MDQIDIVSQLDNNINSNSALETLMQVDNVLERLNVYAYKNWIEGEVVEGPRIERYWVTVTLMYPEKLMPDPDGATRIIDFGGKVYYAKDKLVTAAKLVDPEDRDVMDGGNGLRPGKPRGSSTVTSQTGRSTFLARGFPGRKPSAPSTTSRSSGSTSFAAVISISFA